MISRFLRVERARRSSSGGSLQDRLRSLRIESVEPRMLLNAAPTVAHAVGVNNPGPVIEKTAALSVLGADDGGESHLVYKWSATSVPSGGAATFSVNNSNAAKNEVVTFTKAGTYNLSVKIVDASGLSVTSATTVVVTPTLTTIGVSTAAHQTLSATTPLKVLSASQGLVAQGLDQFGAAMAVQPTFSWASTSAPAGVSAPAVTASGGAATIAFDQVGNYGLTVEASAGGTSVSRNLTLSVAAHPTSFSVTQAGGASPVAGKTAQFTVGHFVDQFNNTMSTATTISWAAASMPSGASAPAFATSNGTTTVTFKAAGNYVLKATERDSLGDVLTQSVTVTVTQVMTSAKNSTTPAVAGTSQILVLPTFVDQFGKNMTTPPAVYWSVVTAPSGAPTPSLATNGAATTATFAMAGTYSFKAAWTGDANIAGVTTVIVKQTATTIGVTPGATTLYQNNTQQFAAKAYDQFHNLMTAQPAFTWSTAGGKITSAGLFTAPSALGGCTITARSGAASGTASVTVQASSGGYQTFALASLVQSLDADGSISRQDMIQIFGSVSANGAVTAAEFADLKTILNQATALGMADYVRVLASDVINGNAANATFQGQKLGNLAVGSSAAQLNNLVGKWFLGADVPALSSSSYTYKTAAGSLFPHTPTHADEYQGQLGDCYFISALGTIADSNPSAIQNMFIDNGDGTFTVRFYTGSYGYFYNPSDGSYSDGFTNNLGTADYVTVDRRLATTASGMLVYSDYGANYANSANALWIPLAEKAYAEWNQTGKEGRDGKNAFASIEGGWMATVDAQILGHNASDYSMTAGARQYAINALTAHYAVTIGTAKALYGLVASHAYAITGYNASTDTFTLYNPWGSYQPGALSWSQLQAACSGFVVATTSGSTPISSGVLKGAFGASNFSAGADGGSASSTSGAEAGFIAAVYQGDWSADDLAAADNGPVSLPAVDALFASDASAWDEPLASAA